MHDKTRPPPAAYQAGLRSPSCLPPLSCAFHQSTPSPAFSSAKPALLSAAALTSSPHSDRRYSYTLPQPLNPWILHPQPHSLLTPRLTICPDGMIGKAQNQNHPEARAQQEEVQAQGVSALGHRHRHHSIVRGTPLRAHPRGQPFPTHFMRTFFHSLLAHRRPRPGPPAPPPSRPCHCMQQSAGASIPAAGAARREQRGAQRGACESGVRQARRAGRLVT